MKSQTIYFLQSLYEAKPEYCQMILQSVARQLIQVCEQYEKYCGLNEMWILDEKGQKILEKLSEQKMDLLNLNIPEDAFAKMKKLECIFQEIMQMQEECCLEIHSTGGLDPDKLHLVADSWKDTFMYRLADQIIIELYRILVYGSEEQFYSVPSLFEMNLDFEKIYPVYNEVFKHLGGTGIEWSMISLNKYVKQKTKGAFTLQTSGLQGTLGDFDLENAQKEIRKKIRNVKKEF